MVNSKYTDKKRVRGSLLQNLTAVFDKRYGKQKVLTGVMAVLPDRGAGVPVTAANNDLLHTDLADMPSAVVADHDGRYYTEAEIDARVLDDIFDVNAPAPNDNDVLAFDSVSGTWISEPNAAGADEKVKVSADDTTAGYLNGKLVAGHGMDFVENNPAGNETLTLDVDESELDHGLLGGLGDDDHTQYVKLAGRAGGQIINGGTASSDDLTLNSTSHVTKGDVIINTNFEVNGAGAHLNLYNGIVIAAPGVVPDTAAVVFATALPDTDYTIELTGQIHEYAGPFMIFTEPGILLLDGVHVSTTWQIIPGTKTVNGFSVSALHTVTDSTAGTEPGIAGWSICPHHSTLLRALATFYTFVAHVDNYTCNWAVRRF